MKMHKILGVLHPLGINPIGILRHIVGDMLLPTALDALSRLFSRKQKTVPDTPEENSKLFKTTQCVKVASASPDGSVTFYDEEDEVEKSFRFTQEELCQLMQKVYLQGRNAAVAERFSADLRDMTGANLPDMTGANLPDMTGANLPDMTGAGIQSTDLPEFQPQSPSLGD